MKTHDPVSHPKHYTSHPSGVEVIDLIRELPYGLASAVKYVVRRDLKGNPQQDLKKALFCLEDARSHAVSWGVARDVRDRAERFIAHEDNEHVRSMLEWIFLSDSSRLTRISNARARVTLLLDGYAE